MYIGVVSHFRGATPLFSIILFLYVSLRFFIASSASYSCFCFLLSMQKHNSCQCPAIVVPLHERLKIMLFEELPLEDEVLDGLQAMNFHEATPIQEQAIPVIIDGKDVIACAQTGTGKTAAFILPLLNNLLIDGHEENALNAIIMAPTRELAQQIDQQMEGFSYFLPFSSVAVYGGNDGQAWEVQKNGLTKGADVVIATPGRLLSHINLYPIDFSHVKYFILDEADRMLDMGFYDDIMQIVKRLPRERQTILFSATMPDKIRELARTIMHNPTEVKIAVSMPPEAISQSAYICKESQKNLLLQDLLKDKNLSKVILFSSSKLKVKELTRTLRKMGIKAHEMHSDLQQEQRNAVMHEFRNNRVEVLVATDIVSRGIDVDDIPLVINYDVPRDAEDYVHRIGRTARAANSGLAITLVSEEDQHYFKRIETFLKKDITKIPLPHEMEPVLYQPVEQRTHRRRFSRKQHKPYDHRGKGRVKKHNNNTVKTNKTSNNP